MSTAQEAADRIKARRAADPTAGLEVGDTVTVGRGQKLWTIERFWTSNGSNLATLKPVDGYSGTSVHVSSLHRVDPDGTEDQP